MSSVLGLILAGGKAERFGGGDKCLRLFHGRPLLTHILRRLRSQTDAQVLSANGDIRRFDSFQVPTVPDADIFENAGPIAGLISGMHRAKSLGFEFVLTVPGDAPLFPLMLQRDLRAALHNNDCARVESGGNPHPVFALWRTSCLEPIEQAATNRTRALWRVQQGLKTITLSFENDLFDPFSDVDTPEELATLERITKGFHKEDV